MRANTLPSHELLEKMKAWKADLIRRGWTDGYDSPPPPDAVIEYHAVWLNDYDKSDNERPGSHRYLMMRWDKLEVPERVWRISKQ